MMKNILGLFVLLFAASTAASTDYYEEHLAITSPIGEISIGRSLVKGGWVYGYDLFNKNFDKDALKFSTDNVEKSTVCEGEFTTPNCVSSATFSLKILAAGNQVNDLLELARCDVYMEFYNGEYRGMDTVYPTKLLFSNADVKAIASNCSKETIAHYLPAKKHLLLGLGYENETELNAAVSNVLKVQAGAVYYNFEGDSDYINKDQDTLVNLTDSLIAEYYDPDTQLTYGADKVIRHVRKQAGEKIYFNWGTAPDDTKVLVPQNITTSNGNVLLTIETVDVDDNGFKYRLPTKLTDATGRSVSYLYEASRIKEREDAKGNKWLYSYENYNPLDTPSDTLVRLSGTSDPEKNVTAFNYYPATAVISGYKTPAGDGFYRQASWQKDSFGKNQKSESKIYYSGRVEERLYSYDEVLEAPLITTDASEQAPSSSFNVLEFNYDQSSSNDDQQFIQSHRMVYVSYGQILMAADIGDTLEEYALKIYGRTGSGGNAANPDNDSTRILQEVRINGEVMYEFTNEFTNINGTEISNTTITSPLGAEKNISRYFDNYSRASIPGSVTTIDTKSGASERIEYDQYAYIKKYQKGDVVQEYERDKFGNILKETITKADVLAAQIDYTYDERGNVLTESYPALNGAKAATYIYKYNDNNQLTKRIDALGYEWNYADFDATGQEETITDPRGKVWKYKYDLNGNMESYTNAKTHKYQFEYAKNDEYKGVIYPDDSKISYQLDGDGFAVARTDQLGHTTRYEFDAGHRMTAYIGPKDDASSAERQWSYQYTPFNDVKELKEPAGQVTRYNYRLDQLQSIEYPTYKVNLSYDKRDNVTEANWETKEGLTRKNKYGYDLQGDFTQFANGLNHVSEATYDALGLKTEITDANGGITKLNWDSRGNLLTATDAENRRIQFEYNANDWLVKEIRHQGETREYGYYNDGSIKQIIDAKGQVTTFEYDDVSNLTLLARYSSIQAQTANQAYSAVSFGYDQRNRLIHYDDKQSLLTGSAPVEELAIISSGDYDYNLRGDITEMVVHYGTATSNPISKTQTFDYFPNGNLKSYTNPENITYQYKYNLNNELQTIFIPSIGQMVYSNFEWHVPNRLMFPGGAQLDLSHDGFRRLTGFSLNNAQQQSVSQAEYGYDAEDNLTSIKDSQGEQSLNYNNRQQLTQHQYQDDGPENSDTAAALEQTTRSYQYDGIGNRTGYQTTNGSQVWGYNDNDQLVSITETNTAGQNNERSFEYDTNGSLVIEKLNSSITKSYEYNLAGRLIKINSLQGSDVQGGLKVLAEYGYGPFGHRLWKKVFSYTESGSLVESNITYFHYNLQGLAAEYDAQGQLIAEYHYAPARGWSTTPLFTRQKGQVYFYQNDLRNAPERIIDVAGNLVWQASYNSFGEASIDEELFKTHGIKNPLRFPGQYHDQETNLHYNFKRYYDPQLGRYLREDPLGTEGSGLNLYAYANLNPFKYKDARGEYADSLLCFAITTAMGCPDFTCLAPGGGWIKGAGKAIKYASKQYNKRNKKKDGPCPIGCFSADTKVVTSDGEKAISEIKEGDLVLAENVVTKEQGYKPVNQVFTFDDRGLYELTLEDGDGQLTHIEVTDDHPFWVTDFGWMNSIDLVPGLNVDTRTEQVLTVIDLKFLNRYERVYNFEVQDWHTYYVGDAGVLVHNADKPCGVIYKRTDRNNPDGKPYIGQAKNDKRYEKRQKEHGRDNPDADYSFEEVDRAEPGRDLDRAEQNHIDANGGPTTKNNNGGTSNKRNQVSKRKRWW
jgi:RHS repeat-associated protein